MRRRERGQAVVEMAFVLPFLALLVLGGLDLGRAYYYTTALYGAAREGVILGSDHATPSVTNIKQAVIAAAPELSLTASSVQVTYTCVGCYGDTTKTFTSNPQNQPTVSVTVSWTYQPLTPLIGTFFPGGKATLVGSAEGPVT